MAIQSAGKKMDDRNLSNRVSGCDFYRHLIFDRLIDWLNRRRSNLIANKKMNKPLRIKWTIYNFVV